ncbi:hypothetical protein [Paenibacillus antarcticus]|uniref:Peptidase M56 BlaR1 n=1 Tax=Paenibacillus antarcticus TaxID=253703 RepID=A0A168LFC9_9BACL|nr:hypothetical protein [Paenibacillus antarcticus]OAB43315.1 hypothetical protein PBAT_18590 [Paenibacillus antarcticus]
MGIRIVIIGVVCVIGLVSGTMALDSTNANYAINQSSVQAPNFPKNESGQTYGSASDATSPYTEPDLIKAYGVDGTNGYVLKKDLDGEMPTTPEEALAQQKSRPAGGRDIPLYDVDGKTVIGVFHIG